MIDINVQARISDGRRCFELAVALQAQESVVALYGPSGAGKSLTLQAIAGLLKPQCGHVRVGGRTLYDAAAGIDLPIRQRGVGYLFQHYALFPHLTVRDNVAFGLTRWWRPGMPPRQLQRVNSLLEGFGLTALANSRPKSLSGGQQQRAALARALACQPSVLLLDEPFSALNPMLRHSLRLELLQMQAEWKIPIMMITHDVEDVLALADIAYVIEQGRVARSVVVRKGGSQDAVRQALLPDEVPRDRILSPAQQAVCALLQVNSHG